MKRLIKKTIGCIFMLCGIALILLAVIEFTGGEFWVGGLLGIGGFLVSLGLVFLFDFRFHDVF